MLASSIAFIRDELDLFCKQRLDINESCVIVNNLGTPNGNPILENQNKIIITLINICQETNKQFYGGFKKSGEQIAKVRPAQMFAIDLLFTSQFDDYEEALKFIDTVLMFFQLNPTLQKKNVRSEEPGGSAAEKTQLEFEVHNVEMRESYSLWNSLGVKYAPSIVYKMKYLVVDGGKVIDSVPEIKIVDVEADIKADAKS